MKEIVDLIKKLLELVPASLKAGKGVLGLAAGVLKTLGKLLPKKKGEKAAPETEPKCKGKCKCCGKAKKLGVLGILVFVGVCALKSLQALQKAKRQAAN
jgi:hypothetical protein